MKKIFFLTAGLLLTVSAPLRAQDAATQQQFDQLNSRIQELQESQLQEAKRLDAIEKELADLSVKVNTPQVNDSASAGDLKKLAEAVREIDQKRLADRELITGELNKLAKVAAQAPLPTHAHHDAPAATHTADDPGTPAVSANGYDYEVKSGDTVGGIARKYQKQGVKVTVSQILKANPGLNPNALYVGKKIFIPDANAK